MDTATPPPQPTLRSLDSRAWHGSPDYPVPGITAPRTALHEAPAYYSVLLAHPGPGTRIIHLPFHAGCHLSEAHRGLTIELLLGMVTDRLETYQRGAYVCAENRGALDHVRQALACLSARRARVDAEETR